MPINTLEYAKLFQSQLDTQIVQAATSGWMEANAGEVKYNGGNEIKIPTVSTQGMGDYDRDEGFKRGAVTLAYQTHTMTQDRGRLFRLDAMDVDETNFGAAAANVMAVFQKTRVVPEIDAYRYSKMATVAEIAAAESITAANVMAKLKEQLYAVADKGADLENLVISMAYPIFSLLTSAPELTRQLNVTEFTKGNVETKVKSLDGAAIIPVSSDRMKTAFVFCDGETSGQEAGGFVPAEGAKAVNWIISPKTAPVAISKTDKMKIITPEVNQRADAYDLHYRKYHELIIPDQRKAVIAVSREV